MLVLGWPCVQNHLVSVSCGAAIGDVVKPTRVHRLPQNEQKLTMSNWRVKVVLQCLIRGKICQGYIPSNTSIVLVGLSVYVPIRFSIHCVNATDWINEVQGVVDHIMLCH